jgi:hypothetical protein
VASLLARIEYLIGLAGGRQRELGRRAGLSPGGVGTIVHRLRKNPNASIDPDTLVKLAKGAEVSLQWLATGEGSPHDTLASESTNPQYRNLPGWAEAMAVFRKRGVPDNIIQKAGIGRDHAPQAVTMEFAAAVIQTTTAAMPLEEEIAAASTAIERSIKADETRAANKLLGTGAARPEKGARKETTR